MHAFVPALKSLQASVVVDKLFHEHSFSACLVHGGSQIASMLNVFSSLNKAIVSLKDKNKVTVMKRVD